MGRGPKPAKSKVGAKRPLPPKSPKNDGDRVRDLEKRLAEALKRETEGLKREAEAQAQQMATAEILRVISRSQTDVQPVFDAIVATAVRLLEADSGLLTRIAGDQIEIAALTSTDPAGDAILRAAYPLSRHSDRVHARVIRDRAPLNVADAQTDPRLPDVQHATARARGYRSHVAVPLLRHDEALGAIAVTRHAPGGFTDDEIALLQTFADQAVIAIENVRLFQELQARNRDLTTALDTQTATADILRVISSSPTDVQPVFDAVAESAARLCDAIDAAIWRQEGEQLRLVAHHGPIPALKFPPVRGTIAGRTVLEARTLHFANAQSEDDEFPESSVIARREGWRSILSVPLMREGVATGAIVLRRTEARLFTERQVALLQTFADQAVIAIENARLFKELEEKNQALTQAHAQVTEALEQQTATAEILRVISQSPTDVQPVFDAVAENAATLCQAQFCHVFRFDGTLLHIAAHYGLAPEGLKALQSLYPAAPGHGSAAGRSLLSRDVEQIPDINADADYRHSGTAAIMNYRSIVAVPMLRDGVPVGCVVAGRSNTGSFPERLVRLLQTFADQAVIAIENVRLFNETKEALGQQTATAEILRVISSSPTDTQPVFKTIVENATRLCEANVAALFLYDGEYLHAEAHQNTTAEFADYLAGTRMRPSHETTTRLAALERRTVHVADLLSDPTFAPPAAHGIEKPGTVLSVPMLREGSLVGVITTWRREVRPFTDKQIALVQTFADQAVIAVENVRLFRELEARTDDLTRSVGELRALGEVGQAISSTLDLQTVLSTIVARATQLSGTDAGVIYEYDEGREVFVPRATAHLEAEIVETMLATPVRKGEGATGRLAESQEPIQMPDVLEAPAESRVRGVLVRAGYRALLAVPLVREDRLIGGLTVIRRATGEFAPEVIDLLRTFATQSALAIQNARLFLEIEDKSRQLEVVSQHKSEFLANMSHELRTPLNAIIGFSEVLSERMFGELSEKQEEYLKDIHASGQHLLSLINDILDLSKIEAGRMELELVDFDLPTAVDNALTLVRERAGRRGIALHQAVDQRLGQIQGDERKIKQVLLNLLSNALKFTPEGGRVDVRATVSDGMAEVSVSDTGVGIAPEDQEAVFEEFRQVGTADKKVEGTGLGLALSRKFIELHGGRIWVKSEVGKGATFTFKVPVRRDE